ncbi:MAG: alcohol dehydrogenase catalytic domain-containing protein [Gammaproteobacteria bacterium]|nr:alcohol dehydrogenase catalytic domain-containing protein [Gammaproteobacteria bacterium]
MRGLTLDGVETITYRDDLPEPLLEVDTDAIVAVHQAGLCGSDLHPYLGREVVRSGVIPGHEVVGEVTEIGSAVGLSIGRRVIVPFTTSCGECDPCWSGLSARCVRGELFGYGDAADPSKPALQGGQAEFLRVPFAESTLVTIPEGISDEEALLLSDNFPTGWHAARRAAVRPGRTVAVVGLGSVGLSAVAAAKTMGAERILAIDPVEDRRNRAERLGAHTAHPRDAEHVAGPMAEGGFVSVIEAVGASPAQGLAFRLLRPGGTLSIIAVQTADRFAFTPVDAYDRNATIRTGRAPVRSVLDRLLPLVVAGRVKIPTDVIVTHPGVPIERGPEMYRRFAAHEPGLVKVVFSFS